MKTEYTQLISDYLSTLNSLSELISTIKDSELDRIPEGESWSIRKVIAHLVDSEIVGITRTRQVIADDSPRFMVYDQEKWAGKLFYEQLPVNEAMTIFKMLRNYQARLLYATEDASWLKTGIHPERGTMTLLDLVKVYTAHGSNHLRQIERILGKIRNN